jgi:hypothetical protein
MKNKKKIHNYTETEKDCEEVIIDEIIRVANVTEEVEVEIEEEVVDYLVINKNITLKFNFI